VVFLRRLLIVALPLLLASMTFLRADLWGDDQQQAEMWAEKNPASPRAQAYAAAAERARGRPDIAIARLRSVRVAPDDDIQIALNLLGAECDLGRVVPADIVRADAALRNARITGQLGYNWFTEAIERITTAHACSGLDASTIRHLLDAADANPNSQDSAGRRQDNLSLRGSLAIATRDPGAALLYFNQALDAKPDPDAALNQAAQLGAAGYPRQGLAELDHLRSVWTPNEGQSGWSMASVHAWVLRRQRYWENEIATLRKTLQGDADRISTSAAVPTT
jgi:tetratricopeptide (TPR) repeat protein